ncbi:MAG: uroporphyrinogen-III decarboxylase [Solibacillus sp.]
MVKTKFANLEPEQLKELKNLEEKLEVTLLAYDHFATEEQSQQENSSDVINPS